MATVESVDKRFCSRLIGKRPPQVDRRESATMKCLSRGLGAMVEAGKYTCATFEYTGLVSYSALRSGCRVVAHSVRKVTTPVARVIASPFERMRRGTDKLSGRKNYFDEKFESVEEKLAHIEAKLAAIESRGMVPRGNAAPAAPPRQVDMGRKALLRQIVEANKSLIDL